MKMEKGQRVRIRTFTTEDGPDPVGPTTATLSRWSSEPGSLSSSGGGDGAELLERTRCSVAALRHALVAERERCRRLEAALESATIRTGVSPTIVHCIEHDPAEDRALPVAAAVAHQRRTTVTQRRQSWAYQLRPNVDDSRVSSSEDLNDGDDSLSDFEMVSLHPECSNCTADNDRRMVLQLQSFSFHRLTSLAVMS